MKQLLISAKAFLKRWWILITSGLILLFITFRGCRPLPSHKDDKKTVDSAYTDYKAIAAVKAVENDSLRRALVISNRDKAAAEHRADSLESELMASTEELHEKAGELKANLTAGDQARAAKDTPRIVSNADSLRDQVRSALVLADRWAKIADSTVAAHKEVMRIRDQQDSVRDKMLVNMDYQLRKADTTIDLQNKMYDALSADYSKARRGYNFNKTLSRVEAGAILVALIKIFIIK